MLLKKVINPKVQNIILIVHQVKFMILKIKVLMMLIKVSENRKYNLLR